MIRALRNAWRNMVEAGFSADHPRRFALRIRLRVLALRFRLWRRRPKLTMVRHHWPKPIALLFVGIAVPVAFGWLLSLFFPVEASGLFTAFSDLLTDPERSRLEWREAAQVLLLLIGVPSAFLLWLFRDINVSGTLDNQRKDVNLKEFQEIQMRAAGALDERLPADARETLQIAALHQLRAFLRGEYGKSFRRPAFELLRARFVASAQATGSQAIHDWLEAWRREAKAHLEDLPSRVATMRKTVDAALLELKRNRVAETERSILNEEWQAVFRSGMPLAGSTFDQIWLNEASLLANAELIGCRFIGAILPRAHLENALLFNADMAFARLFHSHFEGAFLARSHLEGAQFSFAHLERAKLDNARIDGADFSWAKMDWANLSYASLVGASLRSARLRHASLSRTDLRQADFTNADLTGADLSYARIEGAIIAIDPATLSGCREVVFDDATELAKNWETLAEPERDAARAAWIGHGAHRILSDGGRALPLRYRRLRSRRHSGRYRARPGLGAEPRARLARPTGGRSRGGASPCRARRQGAAAPRACGERRGVRSAGRRRFPGLPRFLPGEHLRRHALLSGDRGGA